ncbi:MAG TPA: L,D-transpeptidase [Kofleriaceae bacterium]|nr:L,D-transpeptidase [Kofleriaceae bacterium]
MRRALLAVLLLGAQPYAARAAPPAPCLKPVPVYAGGQAAGAVCPEDAPRLGLTLVDLSDEFVPRVLRGEPGRAIDHAGTYRALAGEDWSRAPAGARRDRFFELWGVFPTFGVLQERLADDERHHCHEGVDDARLARFAEALARDQLTPKAVRDRPERRAAIGALQEHLVCDGLLAAGSADRIFGRDTEKALDAYRRRHMVAAGGALTPEGKGLLLGDSREHDFRALLRALRERVVDATGLIEDGSARAEWELVLGRALDSPTLRDTAGHPPLENGAPDLVSPAVEAAARALGWLDPASARASLAAIRRAGVATVALPLPPVPRYHGPAMELRAEIDRGDVWYEYPFDARGDKRPQPRERRPVLTLYARDGEREVALVRWPTTIGTWQRERRRDGEVVMRYKGSLAGEFLWREIVAAPAWFAPPGIPDMELVRREGRRWVVQQDAIGPGYRSAYGLVMIIHRTAGGADTTIRTHGTGSYLSIPEGAASHGCHRLMSHHALRLAGFLLAHRPFEVRGELRARYEREVRWAGKRFTIRRRSRGYARVLDPPVPVEVLPGRIRGRDRRPIQRSY